VVSKPDCSVRGP